MRTPQNVVISLLLLAVSAACQPATQPATSTPVSSSSANNSPAPAAPTDAELSARLKSISDRAGGNVSVAVIHVETGRSASVNGSAKLPLYSIFKLPLAIAVLKDVEEKRLQIDQKIQVNPSDIVPGVPSNTRMWLKPVERNIAELIDVSVRLSDNTSSDKLLQQVGGPEAVTRRMRSFGFDQIHIQTTIRDFVDTRKNVNIGSAGDLAKLLVRLQKGELLQPAQQEIVTSSMLRSTTGLRRLRGDLPSGTVVAGKTGSGEMNEATKTPTSTNDIGLITLPNNAGHLAIAVLLNGSALSDLQQEKVIAQVARAAYDAFIEK